MLFGQDHVKRYVETDGEEGHDWQGTTTLILTTTGRRSRREAQHPVDLPVRRRRLPRRRLQGRGRRASGVVSQPRGRPRGEVQVRGERFGARARTAGAQEKPAMWQKMVGAWPAYDDYQQKTDREIPVVVLERA